MRLLVDTGGNNRKRKEFIMACGLLVTAGLGAGPRPAIPEQRATLSPAGVSEQGQAGSWRSITRTRFAQNLAVGINHIGVATEGGLLVHDRLRERWLFPYTRADGLPDTRVESVTEDHSGVFVVQTRQGPARVDPVADRAMAGLMVPPGPRRERPVLPVNLFAGPDYLYLGSGRLSGPAALTVAITDAAADDLAGIWITTWGFGIGRIDSRTLQLEMKPHGLWSSDVQALAVQDDLLVAGGWGDPRASGGLTWWERSADRWRWILAADELGLANDRVSALALQGGQLWMAVEGGIARGRPGGRWQTWGVRDGLPDGRTTALVVWQEAAWIGTMQGAAVVAADTISVLPLPGPGRVRSMSAGAGGVWLATDQGALVWRGGWPGGQLLQLQHPGNWFSSGAAAVATWQQEVWWASSMGLARYHADSGQWDQTPPPPPGAGFRSEEITALAVDEQQLWVGTWSGAYRFDRGRGEWRRYGQGEGMIDHRVQCLVLFEGVAWVGTPSGISRFEQARRRGRP